jgi:hypothetical protein
VLLGDLGVGVWKGIKHSSVEREIVPRALHWEVFEHSPKARLGIIHLNRLEQNKAAIREQS